MPGFNSEVSIPFFENFAQIRNKNENQSIGKESQVPTLNDNSAFEAAWAESKNNDISYRNSSEGSELAVNKLLTDPFQFWSPFIANHEAEKLEDKEERVKQVDGSRSGQRLQLEQKMENVQPVCDPELESNGCHSELIAQGVPNDYFNLNQIWTDHMSRANSKMTDHNAVLGLPETVQGFTNQNTSESFIPSQYSSKKEFENYLKRQQMNLNQARNKAVEPFMNENATQKALCFQIPPRVLRETKCNSFDEFESYIRHMSFKERELFEVAHQLCPGALDLIPYSPLPQCNINGSLPPVVSDIQSQDELQSMLNALALKNSLTQNVVSLGNGSTMSSQVNNAKSFDKNKQPSGLMDFPFCVPKMPSRMESDPVKPNSNTSSDMNPNLASLLYTHLPYFQALLMLQNQQSLLNMASDPATSASTPLELFQNASSQSPLNVSGKANVNNGANNLVRNINFNYTLFNELLSQQQSIFQDNHKQTLPNGNINLVDDKDELKFDCPRPFSVTPTPATTQYNLPNSSNSNHFNQNQFDLNAYMTLLASMNTGSEMVKDVMGSGNQSMKNSMAPSNMQNPAFMAPSQKDILEQGGPNFGSAVNFKVQSQPNNWMNLSNGGTKMSVNRGNHGGQMQNRSNNGNRFKQSYDSAGGASGGMHGNNSHHGHGRHQGYQPGSKSRATDLLLANVGLAVEQFKAIENERKKTEVSLAHLFPKHDMRSDNRRPNQPPRLPPNPTRVDRLVGEMQKEHPKTEVSLAHLFPEHDMRSDNRRPNQPPRLPPNPTRVDRLVGEMQKEHPKTEVSLAHLFPEHDMRSDNRRPNQPPRLPPNPTRVDRLVGEMQKEHPKVLMLISKADEVLRQWQDIVSQPIPPEVIITMDQWLAAIRKVQARRREDTNSQANRQRHLPVGPVNGFMPGMNNMQGGNSSRGHDDKDRIALCQAVKELAEITRKARNMQWVFLQFTREAVQKIQNHSNDVAQESNMSSVNALLAEATEKRLLSEDSEDSVFESLPRQIWSTAEGGFF